jgi:hypothetical protein
MISQVHGIKIDQVCRLNREGDGHGNPKPMFVIGAIACDLLEGSRIVIMILGRQTSYHGRCTGRGWR